MGPRSTIVPARWHRVRTPNPISLSLSLNLALSLSVTLTLTLSPTLALALTHRSAMEEVAMEGDVLTRHRVTHLRVRVRG